MMDCFRLQQPQQLCSFARVISNWEGDLKHMAARTSRSLGTTCKKTTKTKKQLWQFEFGRVDVSLSLSPIKNVISFVTQTQYLLMMSVLMSLSLLSPYF